MYGCESWTVKKAECQRIESFELWCWKRLLRVPWTTRRSNQSILKEISPGCSLEGLMLKLKLQYFGYLTGRGDLLEKSLMLGGIGGRRRRGQQKMRWLDSITYSMDMSLSELRVWWWTGRPGVLQFMGSQRVKHDWVTELNWTECIQDGKTENFSYSISPSLLPVQSSFLPHFLLSFQQSCVLSSPTHCLPPILLYTLYSFRHWPFFLILFFPFSCCCSVIQWCMTLCNSMDCSIPGFPVLYYLPKFPETPVHWVDDAISQLFTSGGQSIGASASASVF